VETLKNKANRLKNSTNPTTLLVVAAVGFTLLGLGALFAKRRRPFRADMWE